MDVLAFYLTAGSGATADTIEKEIAKWAKGGGRGAYLWGTGAKETAARAYISKFGRELMRLRPFLGTSQESSIDNFLLSLVHNSDLGILGGLEDASSRKPTQTPNSLARSQSGMRAL